MKKNNTLSIWRITIPAFIGFLFVGLIVDFPIQASPKQITTKPAQSNEKQLQKEKDNLQKEKELLERELGFTREINNKLRWEAIWTISGITVSVAVTVAILNFVSNFALRESDKKNLKKELLDELEKSIDMLVNNKTNEINEVKICLQYLTYEVAQLSAEQLKDREEPQYYPAAVHEYLRAIRILESLKAQNSVSFSNKDPQNLMNSSFLSAEQLAKQIEALASNKQAPALNPEDREKLEGMRKKPEFMNNSIEKILLEAEASKEI